MRYRNMILTVLMVGVLLAAAVRAEGGGSAVFGPFDEHGYLEFEAALGSVLVTVATDTFDAGAATQAGFVGNLDAAQWVVEAGPSARLGDIQLGLGVRYWTESLTGRLEYLHTYWVAPDGERVPYEDAHDEDGGLLAGYAEATETRTRTAIAEQDSRTEAAVLAQGQIGEGILLGSWQASYGASGFAWRVGAGLQVGEVFAGVGYRSWPMDRFYRGPLLGLEFLF